MATRSNQYDVPTYDGDFAAWSFHQAMLLRSGQLHLLDRAWIAEELESLGHEQFDKLESALRVVLMHILKWDYQPERRTRSWTISIRTQRKQILKQLHRNPSLISRQNEAVAEAYDDARFQASGETDLALKIFPVTCPYDWETIMTRMIVMPDDET